MAKQKLEFIVDDEIQTEIRRYWNSPTKFNYFNNQIEAAVDFEIENILKMDDEKLKILLNELMKKFARPVNKGCIRSFDFSMDEK